MVLFDIRLDDSHCGFIEAVNRGLDLEPELRYLKQHGYVGSAKWWEQYDQGLLRKKMRSGTVTWVGPRIGEYNEVEDTVEFIAIEELIRYDRVGYWADHPICVGDIVTITRVSVHLYSPYGNSEWLVDVCGEWVSASELLSNG